MSDLVPRAKEFARLVHRNQEYGKLPYIYHLTNVYSTLKNLFEITDEVVLAASFLHNSIEDTFTTYGLLDIQFGKEVADLVLAVTNSPAKTRNICLKETAKKVKGNKKALMIKLADRISNTECSLQDNFKLYQMYEKEFPKFSLLLRDKTETSFTTLFMWEYLEYLYAPENDLDVEDIKLQSELKRQRNLYQIGKNNAKY